jgi:trehalose/maltose hydrolase-like predicted phosphorylase
MYKNRFSITFVMIFLFVLAIKAQNKKSLWTIDATKTENYVGAPIANGKIGILPWKEPFSVRHVMLNHVFDIGDAGVNQALQGINPFQMAVSIDGKKIEEANIKNWKQSIDLKKAVHTTTFTVPGQAEIKYNVIALRNLPYSGLIQVEVKALKDLSLQAINEMEIPNGYQQIQKRLISANVGLDGGKEMILQTEALSAKGAQRVIATSEYIFDHKKFNLKQENDSKNILNASLKKGETVTFSLVGSICTSRDFNDPKSEAERQVIYVSYLGTERILKDHYRLWEELWKGDIEIEGDDEVQLVARSALFNLYSNILENSRLSISPMGLSGTYYSGHIFWDSEIWMYPPLLMLNQPMAKSMIDYRTDRLKAAENRAMTYGYSGAMFPWESDDKGEEATPINALTGQFEHHITADVAIAFWHYYNVSQDKDWLTKEGYPVLEKIANFWTSRSVKNADGTYSINYVIAADEYAEGIDDNAYTNAAAKKALEYATLAAKICGKKAPEIWQKISENLVFAKMKNGVTQEYKGYDGQMIKQADVNLLAYPLGVITDPSQIKKDLEYYSGKVDQNNGPAMTYSVFAVQYARLGNADRAYSYFKKAYQPNQRPPFGVLAETATSSNPYFMTGAGGILQAIINGFGGLDVSENGIIQQKTVLPKHWKKLTIKGVGSERKDFVVTQ